MEMTQEWITQYNKKCAEFLGEEITTYFIETQMDLIGSNALQFHSDWNWIMEILAKMKLLVCEAEFTYRVGLHLTGLQKEAVIEAIDQFIDWYNKQKES